MNVIRSLENRGILFKGSTRKITSEEGGRFFNFLKPLIAVGLPLMKNILTPNVLVPLGLTAAASATDAALQKKIYGSGTTTLVFSSEGLGDIMKIVKPLEESGLLIKGVTKTDESEVKEQKVRFLGISWFLSCEVGC